MTDLSGIAGRSCPAGYGYGAAVFRRAPDFACDTLYVIGGLYGNPEALDAIEAMAAQEAQEAPQTQRPPTLAFNGDFHWFDASDAAFAAIQRRVLRHIALRGNVETELAADDAGFGCGCGYPDDVGDDEVERSNRILLRLRATAMRHPRERLLMGALPMHAVAQVAGARIGIVHGDAQALAGWGFAQRSLDDPGQRETLLRQFAESGIDVFASSHTCLPALRRFDAAGGMHAVINNGAAGMPNFEGMRHGVISRIASTPAPASLPVLHEAAWPVAGGMLHVAALAVRYDHDGWRTRFLADWPPGSPAHLSYFRRIEEGPAYSPREAYR
ncbi:MAG: hypothetical protein ACJ8G3_26960 [Burkholderiaceae bacterium]